MLQSKELGVYWRGHMTLADGSDLEVVVLRDTEAPFECTVTLREIRRRCWDRWSRLLAKPRSRNGRAALIAAERACNAQLVSAISPKKRRGRLWMF